MSAPRLQCAMPQVLSLHPTGKQRPTVQPTYWNTAQPCHALRGQRGSKIACSSPTDGGGSSCTRSCTHAASHAGLAPSAAAPCSTCGGPRGASSGTQRMRAGAPEAGGGSSSGTQRTRGRPRGWRQQRHAAYACCAGPRGGSGWCSGTHVTRAAPPGGGESSSGTHSTRAAPSGGRQ